VLGHPASAKLAASLCAQRGIPATSSAVYAALATDDLLACGFARLLLLTDPSPLPLPGDVDGAWDYYLRNWRPGAYARGDAAKRQSLRAEWTAYYAKSLKALQ
jgi:hypothetical protein